MKKTVSILTALLLAVSPAAQRAYAQEATVQVQQNVEESKASKVWNTVKEYAGKAANAVAENKGTIAGVVGVTGASLLVGTGAFATYNGVTMKESIKTIWAAEGITIAQKVQHIAKVLFLRGKVTADELANLKNENIVNDSIETIKKNESVIKSTNENLEKIKKEQEDLDKRKATQETDRKKAMCQKKEACYKYNKAQKELDKDLEKDKTCQLGKEYDALDCLKKVEEPKNNGNGTDTKLKEPKNNGNGTDTNN